MSRQFWMMQAGWLADLTQWLKNALAAVVEAIADIVADAVVLFVEGLLKLVTLAVEAIPVPDFLTQYTICGLLANAGPTMAWVVDIMHLGEGMAMVTAAVIFRLLRKVLTLFQW